MTCQEKKQYPHRMAAEHALTMVRGRWRHLRGCALDQLAAEVYCCSTCRAWHLTHVISRSHDALAPAPVGLR